MPAVQEVRHCDPSKANSLESHANPEVPIFGGGDITIAANSGKGTSPAKKCWVR